MLTRNTMALALSAAMILGIAGAAQASSDHEHQSGGFRIGPLGQVFGPSRMHRYGYAYEPRWHSYRHRGDAYAYVPRGGRAWHHE